MQSRRNRTEERRWDVDRKRRDRHGRISVVSSRSCAQIKIDDVEMIEQSGRNLYIYADGKEFRSTGKIENFALALAGKAFYRPLKSTIINFDKVCQMEKGEIHFDSGRRYSMGKNNMSKTRRAYKNYLFRYPPFANIEWHPQ